MMWNTIVSIVTIFLCCFTTVYALPFNNVQGQKFCESQEVFVRPPHPQQLSPEQAGKQTGKSKQEADPLKLIRQWIEFTLTSPGGSAETWSYEVFYRSDLSAHAAILVNIFLSGVKISDDYFNAEAKVFIGDQYDAYLKAAGFGIRRLFTSIKACKCGARKALEMGGCQ